MPKLPRGVLELAVSQAKKSVMLHKHGAVIWKSGTILGAGYNQPKQPPTQPVKRRYSIHGERDALAGLRADQIHGSSMLAVRVRSNGTLSFGSPCRGCTKLLSRKGVSTVYWFDELGNLNATYLRSYKHELHSHSFCQH